MEPENRDHIRVIHIQELVYCDPAVRSADHAIVDMKLQAQPGDMVATLNLKRGRSIKYYQHVSSDAELVIGTVIEFHNRGFRPPLLASE